jgi:hypothetical protein
MYMGGGGGVIQVNLRPHTHPKAQHNNHAELNAISFDTPFSEIVGTNIGHSVQSIVEKHFPSNRKLH